MSCCTPCSPGRSLSRCCSSQCLDGADRCCYYMFGSGSCCCSPCCSCSRLACCPSVSCCIPFPCRPCRPKHIWDIRAVVPTGNKDVCCPPRRPRKPSRESRASRWRMRKDEEDCPACLAIEESKRSRLGGSTRGGGHMSTLHTSGASHRQRTVTPPNKHSDSSHSQTHPIPGSKPVNHPDKPTLAAAAPLETVQEPKTPSTAQGMVEGQETGKLSTIPSYNTSVSAVSLVSAQSSTLPQNSTSLHQSELAPSPIKEENEMQPTDEANNKGASSTEAPCHSEAVPDLGRRKLPVTICMEISTQTDLLKLPITKEPSIPPLQPVSTPSIPSSAATPAIMISPSPSIATTQMLHTIIPPRNVRTPVGIIPPVSPVNPYGLPFVCMPFPLTLGMNKEPAGCPLCGGKNACTESCHRMMAMKGDHNIQKYLRGPSTKDMHPEKPFCDKKASLGDQSSMFTEMTSCSNPSSADDRRHGNTNSVFFIRRDNTSAGGRDISEMRGRNTDSATQGSMSSGKYRESRRSRYQNQDRGDSCRLRSPSLRSISSQTSADLRKFSPERAATGFRHVRYITPRTFTRSPKKPMKVAASQTKPSHFDLGIQTAEDEGKKFAPQNVFFVATPNVTDAWCRAVCGDTVAELPKILEKFGSATKKVSETSIASGDIRKSSEGLSEVKFRKMEVMNDSGSTVDAVNENPTHPSEGEICDESPKESREKVATAMRREKYPRKSPTKGLPPTSPTPVGMLKRSDMLKMSNSEMTKREMIACLLGRTDDKSKGPGTIQGNSASKISESGSMCDMKNFNRLSRASSLQRPCIPKSSIADMAKKEKSNSISGMSDVVMAGPAIGVEKGVCANLRSKMEVQARNANMINKDRVAQYNSNTVGSGSPRPPIKKYVRRVMSPPLVTQNVNRRNIYGRNGANASNVSPTPITSAKNNKLCDSKPTLNPSNFGREVVLRSTLNEQLKQSENNKNQPPDAMNWREAMGAISVTRVSMKPRNKGCEIIEEGDIKDEYEPAMPEETDPPNLYPKDDQQDEAYDVSEVEVPANTNRNVTNDPLGDEEELYDIADQEPPPPFVTSRREITPNGDAMQGPEVQSNSRERTFVTQRRGGYHWDTNQKAGAVQNNEKRSYNQVQTRPQLVDQETEMSQKMSPLKKPRDISLPRRVIPMRTETQASSGPPAQVGESGRYVPPSRPSVHSQRRVSPTVAPETRIMSQSNHKRRVLPVNTEPVTEASESLVPSSSPNRSLESRVEIEDVGADESDDESPPPNWSLQPMKNPMVLRRDKSNLSRSSKNSRHSMESGPPRKKSSMGRGGNTLRSSSNPQQGVNMMDTSPGLLRPTSASLPSNMEGLLREGDEDGERRRTRHEYYTSPLSYGLKLSKSTAGTQALPPRPQHCTCNERRCCGMNHQCALMTIPQPHGPLFQHCQCTHNSKTREASPKSKRTIDLRSAYDKGRENTCHFAWSCQRKESKSSLRSGFSDDDWYEHKSHSMTTRKPKMKDVDYGPEVLVDSRNYLRNVPVMRTRGERSYADAGEIVLPKQRKSQYWNDSKGRPRKDDSHPGEKKRKEFYFEFGPQSQTPCKFHRYWCRNHSPERERSPDRDGRSKDPEYTRRQSSRKMKHEELYELGDCTGESDVEYHRKWKHSQLSLPKQRHLKSTKGSRIYAYSPSKRRIISTPGTPMTSSSNSPHYRHHYRRRSAGRDLNRHAGQRTRKRSVSKWD